MTTIATTPGMTLSDIVRAAYMAAPQGIDYGQTPDGNIVFTDEARPGEQFRIGPDTEYTGDTDSVAWAEWSWTEDQGWDACGSDGCSVSSPATLVAALTRWIDAR